MKKQIVKTMVIAFLVMLSVPISGIPLVAGQEFQYPPRPYILMDPASKVAALGQVFTVDVKINADSFWDIVGYDVMVEYNSTIITLLNATEGGFLKQGRAGTFGFFDTSVPGAVHAVDTKLSDPAPSSGVDTLFMLQFKVTCQFSHQPLFCNLELNNTDLSCWSHPERNIGPWWGGELMESELPYDPRPVPPALPYTHYTVGGTFSVNLGDVNNDGTINLQDLVSFANAYGSHCANYDSQGEPASPNWNERADLAPPLGRIGLTDLVTFEVYCNKRANDWLIQGKGTVKYLDFEGGFYGITGDDGNNYDPLNMPPEFKVDGLRVQFTANLTNRMSTHIWGYVVNLLSIERLP